MGSVVELIVSKNFMSHLSALWNMRQVTLSASYMPHSFLLSHLPGLLIFLLTTSIPPCLLMSSPWPRDTRLIGLASHPASPGGQGYALKVSQPAGLSLGSLYPVVGSWIALLHIQQTGIAKCMAWGQELLSLEVAGHLRKSPLGRWAVLVQPTGLWQRWLATCVLVTDEMVSLDVIALGMCLSLGVNERGSPLWWWHSWNSCIIDVSDAVVREDSVNMSVGGCDGIMQGWQKLRIW